MLGKNGRRFGRKLTICFKSNADFKVSSGYFDSPSVKTKIIFFEFFNIFGTSTLEGIHSLVRSLEKPGRWIPGFNAVWSAEWVWVPSRLTRSSCSRTSKLSKLVSKMISESLWLPNPRIVYRWFLNELKPVIQTTRMWLKLTLELGSYFRQDLIKMKLS